ncbi:MAG: hypothetical protein AAGB00_09045 [Planctomycetota bacterium]
MIEDNPYASPLATDKPPERTDREQLAEWIRDCMTGKAASLEVVEAVEDGLDLDDPVIGLVAHELSGVDIRPGNSSRSDWKLLRRLLLLLESDWGAVETKLVRWMPSQVIAAAALGVLVAVAGAGGLTVWLWVAAGVGIGVAAVITRLRDALETPDDRPPFDDALRPFRSFGELRAVVGATPSFRPPDFPASLAVGRAGLRKGCGAAEPLVATLGAPLIGALWLAALALPEEKQEYEVQPSQRRLVS